MVRTDAVAQPSYLVISAFDESSYLVFGFALLFGLMAFHLAWMVSQRGGREGRANQEPVSADEEGMLVCPECQKPTEADYRYCRHCVSDVGGRFVDFGDGEGGERSGMF